MKAKSSVAIVLALFAIFSLIGCQGKSTPDTAATVSAAVNATTAAQANMQATVDAAVQATTAAQPTATGAVPTLAAATPKPAGPAATAAPPVNYVAMTEQDLAALIDQSVEAAVAATTAATTAETTAASDGTLTTEEVAAMLAAATTAQSEIDQAMALAQAYYGLYADVSSETLATLQAIEQDLNSMSQSMAQMTQILSEGQATAQAALVQLQAAAAQASSTAQTIQTKVQNWSGAVKAEIDQRANTALNVKPTNVPTDLKGTAQSVSTYISAVHSALGDNKITKTELNTISLDGANAVAGLNAHGGSQFQGLSGSINNVTNQIARGETQNAKSSLGGLEQSSKSLTAGLSIPSGPSLPSAPSLPSGPSVPSGGVGSIRKP